MVRNPGLVYAVVGDADSTVGNCKVGSRDWAINGTPIPTVTEEVTTWQTLRLTFRVPEADRAAYLEPLKTGSQKFDTITAQSGGGFLTVSRTSEQNDWWLTPPGPRVVPHDGGTYYVQSYSERAIDQSAGKWEVTVEFVRDADREPANEVLSEARTSDEWLFDFRTNRFTTKRVAADILTGSAADTGSAELTLVLDLDQTQAVMEDATRLAAVRTRDVPDGPNKVEDNADRKNVVNIVTPDNETPIEEGDYAVKDWEAEWAGDAAYRVVMQLGKLADVDTQLLWNQLGYNTGGYNA